MSASDTPAGTLIVTSKSDAIELRVYNANFSPVARGFGSLEATLPPGIYQVERRVGSKAKQQLVALPGGEDVTLTFDDDEDLTPPTAAPVAGTSTFVQTHLDVARQLCRSPLSTPGGDGALMIFSRVIPARGQNAPVPALAPELLAGFEVLDPTMAPIEAVMAARVVEPAEGWAGLSVRIPPGPYALRLEPPRTRESQAPTSSTVMPLWVSPGWQTALFLPQNAHGPMPEAISMHTIALEQEGWDDAYCNGRLWQTLEVILSGFTAGRWLIPRSQLRTLLNAKFGDPMFGLVGAYCLAWDLLGADGKSQRSAKSDDDLALLRDLVAYLRRTLGPTPDVIALAAQLPERAGEAPSLSWPPLLAQGYQRTIELDALGYLHLEPDSWAERAAASLVSRGPWTSWLHTPIVPNRSRDLTRNPYRATIDWPDSIDAIVSTAGADQQPWVKDLEQHPESDVLGAKVRGYVVEMAKVSDMAGREEFIASLDAGEICRNTNLPVSAITRTLRSMAEEK